MWETLGKRVKSPFNQKEKPENEKLALEEEKKKRKTYLKYNRGKHGIFGSKDEPELIEKEV